MHPIKLRNFISAILFIVMFFASCDSNKSAMSSQHITIKDEITIDEIQDALENKEYTIAELTQFYLDRIKEISFEGPKLNAVITVNPDAMAIAAELDEELKAGKSRGPMHGIPVLLKDNVDTGDKMPCTAGARIMKASFPKEDSPLAAQLRAAGAVILGKTNMSEWANFHSQTSSSGWSGLGGQTKNPYDLSRNPCGSSAGSGAAVSANLCVIAIGTETNGSIVCPSNNNGIVGIKPTVGLISRRGIIPIAFSQDTGGPMARTVRDAAICLGMMTAVDSLDSKTMVSGRIAYTDYTPFLKTGSLKGKKIGYYKSPLGDEHVKVAKVMEAAIDFLKSEGAEIVEIDEIMSGEANGNSFQVLLYEFKDGLNAYLTKMGDAAPVKNLQEIIEKTFSDSIEMRYHDHELLKLAQSKGDLNDKKYKDALAAMHKLSRQEGIDKIMKLNKLDAIVGPTGGPAWKTDLTNGDNFGLSSSSPAAIAGYPSITVPMGNIDGLPVGISIFGLPWTEGKLIEIAYSFEQGTKHRKTPTYLDNY